MDELNYCSTHEKHDYHFKKAKENKFGHHWRLYCSLRNRVNCNITKYYANLINSRLSRKQEGILEISRGNPSYFWAIFTYCYASIVVDGTVLTSARSIATVLNSFFVNIGKKWAEKIPHVPQVKDFCHTNAPLQGRIQGGWIGWISTPHFSVKKKIRNVTLFEIENKERKKN